MQRQRSLGAQGLEHREARPAGDHVIFGVDLEPQSRRRRGDRLFEMLRLEANSGGGKHGRQPLIGESEPAPFGVTILSQVPLSTYFQELPW